MTKVGYTESSSLDIDLSQYVPSKGPYFFTSFTGQSCIVGYENDHWVLTFKTHDNMEIMENNTLRFITVAWYSNVYMAVLKFIN